MPVCEEMFTNPCEICVYFVLNIKMLFLKSEIIVTTPGKVLTHLSDDDNHSGGSLFLFLFLWGREHEHSPPQPQVMQSSSSHIWGNRRGQHSRSAVGEPGPGKTTVVTTVSPPPGRCNSSGCTSQNKNEPS